MWHAARPGGRDAAARPPPVRAGATSAATLAKRFPRLPRVRRGPVGGTSRETFPQAPPVPVGGRSAGAPSRNVSPGSPRSEPSAGRRAHPGQTVVNENQPRNMRGWRGQSAGARGVSRYPPPVGVESDWGFSPVTPHPGRTCSPPLVDCGNSAVAINVTPHPGRTRSPPPWPLSGRERGYRATPFRQSSIGANGVGKLPTSPNRSASPADDANPFPLEIIRRGCLCDEASDTAISSIPPPVTSDAVSASAASPCGIAFHT